VRQLRCGITPKVADATGAFINGLGQLFRCKPLSIPNPFSMRPVLAEKTVERASVVEHSKIFKPVFRTVGMGILGISGTGSTRTDPIRYTIGWEPIIIPTDISFFC
jgi:hypothetical protein